MSDHRYTTVNGHICNRYNKRDVLEFDGFFGRDIEKDNILGLNASYKVHISCPREQPLIDWDPFLCLILHKSQQNIGVNQWKGSIYQNVFLTYPVIIHAKSSSTQNTQLSKVLFLKTFPPQPNLTEMAECDSFFFLPLPSKKKIGSAKYRLNI